MGVSKVVNKNSNTGSVQGGIEAPLYTDEDRNQFDGLMNFGAQSASTSNKKQVTRQVGLQQRPAYSEKDLEKFNKMFSEGHAPYATLEVAKESPKEPPSSAKPSEIQQYSEIDDVQFNQLSPTPRTRQKAAQNSEPKPARKSKSASLYSDGDLELFKQLTNGSRSAKTNQPAKRDRSEFGSDRRDAEKRVPLTEEKNEWKPRRFSQLGKRKTSKPLSVRRPGMGDIKLHYFE